MAKVYVESDLRDENLIHGECVQIESDLIVTGPRGGSPISRPSRWGVGLSDPEFHVLLVEDEESHAMLIQRSFQRSDVLKSRVTVVGTLAGARQIFSSSPPGLAIIDAHLPDGRGVDLLSEEPPCPVVIMTSQEHSATAEKARELGALDYVVKSPAIFRKLPALAKKLIDDNPE